LDISFFLSTLLSIVSTLLLFLVYFLYRKNSLLKLEKDSLASDKIHLEAKVNSIESSFEQERRSFELQLDNLKVSKDSMKLEFKELANEILKSSSAHLTEENAKAINNIVNPFDKEFKLLKEKLDSVHVEDTKQRASLQAEITALQRTSHEVTQTANDLAIALKGEYKSQGKWGELVLENVLDQSGLRLGEDYRLEVSHNTEEGRKRPDAIVYMPGDKHIVIDAKTSLTAYMGLIGAQTEEERSVYLKEHISNVWDRLNELSERGYEDLEQINSPDVVIMFMPIESAYIEVVKHEKEFFQKAIEKNIVIATPSTLLATLNIVKQLWRHEAQSANSAKLAELAQKLSGKLSLYVESIEKLGNTIERARIDHEAVKNHLVSGKGNLIRRINQFQELGVKVQKQLPRELVERADLDVD